MWLSSKYAFIEKRYLDTSQFCLLFINKEACLEAIKSHLGLFQEILQEKISDVEILEKIESASDLFDTLNHHQGLLGILYGFGENNAFAFHDVFEKKLPYKPLKRFDEDHEPLFMFYNLNFVVTEGDLETAFLREKYGKQREQILEAYENGDFLEVTLSKLHDK